MNATYPARINWIRQEKIQPFELDPGNNFWRRSFRLGVQMGHHLVPFPAVFLNFLETKSLRSSPLSSETRTSGDNFPRSSECCTLKLGVCKPVRTRGQIQLMGYITIMSGLSSGLFVRGVTSPLYRWMCGWNAQGR